MIQTTIRPKSCSHCSREFMPARPMQAVCSPICAARKVRADKSQERVTTKARREKLITIPDRIKAAQKEFNAYIRARDSGKPCICCGLPLGEGDIGGAYDCGHYRSTGSASHLRFDERNAHAQRKVCNRWGAGRAVDYRIGLVARIGRAAVEALEADNGVRKWTHEELIDIRARFIAKRKALEAA